MAALALWCLWPGAAPLATLLPAILLAIGAGLLSGTPAGIGAFEVTLIALLPGADPAALLAAALAWRAVYHGLPAALGALLLLRGPRPERRAETVALVPDGPAFPEAGLMRQGLFQPLAVAGCLYAAARTPHALVALRAPLGRDATARDLAALRHRARAEARVPALYKAPARLALTARRAGWAVLALSREAWLSPVSFALDRPDRAPLRRKLRKAAAAGVLARCEAPDMAEMRRLNTDWVAAHGGEQGFSMGRFSPGYLSGQRVYVARVGARPVGFVSFHITPQAWSLDLLRPHPGAPEGTAQALIAAALADAARAAVPRLSLAAVPEAAFPGPRGILRALARLSPGAARAARGLWQFKHGFAPRWERLYLIAPDRGALALAGWDIRRQVLHPPPPADAPLQTVAPADPARDKPIESLPPAWHRGQR
jgi:phosphatidylglycerol lysyltransferase